MPHYFFDSSALVKRYVSETGSAWVRACVDPGSGNRISILRITAVEVTSAIARRRRGATVSAAHATIMLAQLRYELAHEYRIVEVTPTRLVRAMSVADRYALRAYDAVQLAVASAMYVHRVTQALPPVVFVSADLELNAAATAMGIPVEDPNSHP